MQLLRLVAFVLFVLAALAGFGLGIHWDAGAVLGLIASGLACLSLSDFVPAVPPSR